jgi:hypothetical protein
VSAEPIRAIPFAKAIVRGTRHAGLHRGALNTGQSHLELGVWRTPSSLGSEAFDSVCLTHSFCISHVQERSHVRVPGRAQLVSGACDQQGRSWEREGEASTRRARTR